MENEFPVAAGVQGVDWAAFCPCKGSTVLFVFGSPL